MSSTGFAPSSSTSATSVNAGDADADTAGNGNGTSFELTVRHVIVLCVVVTAIVLMMLCFLTFRRRNIALRSVLRTRAAQAARNKKRPLPPVSTFVCALSLFQDLCSVDCERFVGAVSLVSLSFSSSHRLLHLRPRSRVWNFTKTRGQEKYHGKNQKY